MTKMFKKQFTMRLKTKVFSGDQNEESKADEETQMQIKVLEAAENMKSHKQLLGAIINEVMNSDEDSCSSNGNQYQIKDIYPDGNGSKTILDFVEDCQEEDSC